MNGMRLIDKDATILAVDTFNAESNTEMTAEDVCRILWDMNEIDPVYAAGGCYCRECRMRQGLETEKTVLCGYHNCAMRKDDFCSLGKKEEKTNG